MYAKRFCFAISANRTASEQPKTAKKRVAQQAPKTQKNRKSKGTEKPILKTIGLCYTRQTKNPKTPKSKKTGSETQTPKTKEKNQKLRRGTKTKQTEKNFIQSTRDLLYRKNRKTNLHKPGLNPKTPKTTKDKEKGNKKTAKTIL